MGLITWEKKQMKNLDLWDIGLIKLTVLASALIIAKVLPEVLSLDLWVYVAVFVIAMIRPMARFLKKR